MPDGVTHERVNVALLAGAAVARFALFPDKPITAEEVSFAVGYTVGTFLITPDLDLALSQSVRALRNWGPLSFLWRPYGAVFKHRGLSHTYLVGPMTRLAYLALLAFIVVAIGAPDLVAAFFKHGLAGLPEPFDRPTFWLAGLLGYYVSQWVHLVLDGIYPHRRRKRRRRYPRKRGVRNESKTT